MMDEKDQLQLLSNRIKEHGFKHKIQELCLDQLPIVSLTPESCLLLEKCVRLEHLSLCGCSLEVLNFLPFLPQLQILELADNQLKSEHLEPIGKLLKLYELNLENNRIVDFIWTKFLKRNRIATLSLKGNPITFEADYRERIFRALGVDLQTLDGIDRQGNAADQSLSSEDEGSSQFSEDIKQEDSDKLSGEDGENSASMEGNSIDEKIDEKNEKRQSVKENEEPPKQEEE